MMKAHMSSRSKLLREDQGGFSLLEALIAMMILAIGLLGLAGMNIVALSYNVDAKELSLASNLAAEMIERIHHNRQNVTVYDSIDTAQGAPNTCPNAPAGGTQPTARGDCLQWQTSLNASGLNNIQGQVTVTAFGAVALNQNQVVVRVDWTTKQVGGTLGGQSRKRVRPAFVVLQTVVTPP